MPPRYRNVLVAFDGSPESELALAHAVAMAQAYRARLALVAVVAPPPLLSWQAPGGMRGVHETEQAELRGATARGRRSRSRRTCRSRPRCSTATRRVSSSAPRAKASTT